MKVSAQNLIPGMVFSHTAYGDLQIEKVKDIYPDGEHRIHVKADRYGRFVFEPDRMITVVGETDAYQTLADRNRKAILKRGE